MNISKEKTFITKDKITKSIPVVILIILSFIIYSNTLQNGFVYDDSLPITDNNFIKIWTKDIFFFFDSSYFTRSGEASYRPIATLTYFVNYLFWKFNPFGYHLTSVILHIINVLLVFFLIRLISKNGTTSFLTALFFASHPALSEAVNCITYSEDLLTTVFFLSSFIVYIKYRYGKKINHLIFLLSVILFFIALLSKEMAVTLPLMIMLYDIIFAKKSENKISIKSTADLIWKNKFIYSGYFLICIFYLFIRFYLMYYPMEITIVSYGDLLTRLIYVPYNIFNFLKIAFFPFNLNADYVFSYPESFFSFINIISYITVILFIILSFFIYRFSKEASFGIWWFFTALSPVLNIIQISNPIAERYLYLPLIGLCFSISVLIGKLFEKIRIKIKGREKFNLNIILKYSIILIIVVIFSYSTFNRNKIWKDEYSLYKNMAKTSPNSSTARNNLGRIYRQRGDIMKAVNEYTKAIELEPENYDAYNNLGNIYNEIGMIEEAIMEYKKAIQLNPRFIKAYNNLGSVLFEKKNKLDEALIQFKKALEINPEYAEAYCNMGIVYSRKGLYQDALNSYKKAIEISPDFIEARYNLAILYENHNDINSAIEEIKEAIKINPYYISSYYLLGKFYLKENLIDEAVAEYKKVIELIPDAAEAHINLGNLYEYLGRTDEAIEEWQKALKIDPNDENAKEKIERVKK
ncbi:MAG: tetratricopeptide repeat protein [Spirochaetes bacterium]|nr:tetratricopeptide repeat protein [Spirochaetota bacterium]